MPTLVLERGRWWIVEDPTADEPFPTRTEVLPNDLDPTTPDGDPRVAWRRVVCGGNLYITFLDPNLCTPSTGLLELVLSSKAPVVGGSISDFSPRSHRARRRERSPFSRPVEPVTPVAARRMQLKGIT